MTVAKKNQETVEPRSRPRVTVVTPFFNTAAYLAECIESVLEQDYGNWEYVLSDNCSTDGSAEIAAAYAQRDPRIRFVRESRFLSQVGNYNRALRYLPAESVYCKIVQADDWLFPNCISSLVAVAEAHPSVAIVSSYSLRETEIMGAGLPFPSRFLPGRELCRRQLLGEFFVFGSPTTVLYRSDVVRGRPEFFPEGSLHPDTDACYEILQSHDFGFVHQVLCFWRYQEDSISGSARDLDWETLDNYVSLCKYGRTFLDDKERARRLREHERHYYNVLAEGLVRLRGADFWRYHRKGLAASGIEVRWTRLARQLPRAVLVVLQRPRVAAAAGRRILGLGGPARASSRGTKTP